MDFIVLATSAKLSNGTSIIHRQTQAALLRQDRIRQPGMAGPSASRPAAVGCPRFLVVGQNVVVARNRHGKWPADLPSTLRLMHIVISNKTSAIRRVSKFSAVVDELSETGIHCYTVCAVMGGEWKMDF